MCRSAPVLEALESRTLLSRATGIDVSSYQGSPTWSSVFAAGVQFAYVKATQGNYYIDPDFSGDMTGATGAGIVAGAYDFADYTVNPTTEANYFLSTAGSWVGAGFLRPMIDVEASTSDTQTEVSNWVNTWCSTVQKATGVKPIVYTYSSYAATYLNSSVTQWPLWMADYNGENSQTGTPVISPWSSWDIWQYSSSGSISGISGAVDMDVANGTMTGYVIPQLVGTSSQFTTGEVVHVNAASGLKAWNTYSSNGTWVGEPDNTNAIIEGQPVYINGYLRWPVKYAGSTAETWSAGTYLSAGGVPTVTALSASPSPAVEGNTIVLSATVSDPDSAVSKVAFYRETNGTAGLQTGTGGDTFLGDGTSNGSGGWTFSTSSAGLSGTQTYYAVATDSGGPSSAVSSTSVLVKALPTVTLSGLGPNPSNSTQPLTFTATISGGVPNGETITLEDASNSDAILTTGQLSGGSATLNVPGSTLLAGTHNLIAVYGGDANFAATQSAPLVQTVQATVAGEDIFYFGSALDGNATVPSSADDNAIATDKSALLPGQTATSANFTNYAAGINGIDVDINGVANPSALSASDFQFMVGNTSTPSSWAAAPAPTAILVRPGAGAGGSTRIELVWANGAIIDEWIQVTVLADANSGLAQPFVFYFGNLAGDANFDGVVNIGDFQVLQNNYDQPGSWAQGDFTGDGTINVLDFVVLQNNFNDSLTLFAAPAQPNNDLALSAINAAENLPILDNTGSPPTRGTSNVKRTAVFVTFQVPRNPLS